MKNSAKKDMPFDPQAPKQTECHVFDMWLPMPVSNNSLHTIARQGNGIILTSKAREYYAAMQQLLCEQMRTTPRFSGRLCVELWVHEPDKRRRDINNYTKSLFDALEHCGVYADDFQIDETHIYRGEVYKGGRVRVRITQIKEKDDRLSLKEVTAIEDHNHMVDKKEDIIKSLLNKKESQNVSRFYRAHKR